MFPTAFTGVAASTNTSGLNGAAKRLDTWSARGWAAVQTSDRAEAACRFVTTRLLRRRPQLRRGLLMQPKAPLQPWRRYVLELAGREQRAFRTPIIKKKQR
mmetsp:Transcript_47510/g.127199  ORF Transcript_47510/g.127199 Transcript_47510/m.127199 type:complete len:101 (+) Transcript_47510:171-473(+)